MKTGKLLWFPTGMMSTVLEPWEYEQYSAECESLFVSETKKRVVSQYRDLVLHRLNVQFGREIVFMGSFNRIYVLFEPHEDVAMVEFALKYADGYFPET